MALNEYLESVLCVLDENRRKCNRDKKCLDAVLAKLKSREDVLNAQLSGDQPENVRRAIERERQVVFAQRTKGLRLREQLERNGRGPQYGAPHFAT